MREDGCNLYILVLSNGGYDGLGKIREKEMEAAARVQGFKECHVLDHEDLKDGPIYEWKANIISDQIEQYITKQIKVNIDALVTFDD